MKKYLLGLLSVVTACHHLPQTTDPTVKNISVHTEKACALDLSTSFKKITYTLLNEADSFLVGDVERMKIVAGKLYLITSKRLLCFDARKGTPLWNLHRFGNAPEEYTSLYDIWIDPERREIEVLDMSGKKIQRYDMQGVWLKEIKIPCLSFAFYKYNAGEYLLYNNQLRSDVADGQLIHYKAHTNEIKASFFPIDQHLANYFFVVEANNFNVNENGCSFFSCPSDTLYKITEAGQVSPAYVIDFGKNQPPADFYEKEYADIANFATQAEQKDYIYFINNLGENNTHIVFTYKRGKEYYLAIYHKEKAELITGKEVIDGIHFPNMPTELEYHNTAFTLTGHAFYFLLQPFQFMELLDKQKQKTGEKKFEDFLAKHPDIQEIYRSEAFDEQSNPILVTCTFRNDSQK